MKFWLDAQLSPYLAEWIAEEFQVDCVAVRELELRDATDNEIFERAYEEEAIVITKDSDFVHLAEQKEFSPSILWLTMGNTSNKVLKTHFNETFETVVEWFKEGEKLVEMTEEPSIQDVSR